MADDEQPAERIRELVVAEPALTEKTMFGGPAFLVNGNMAVAASGRAARPRGAGRVGDARQRKRLPG